MTDREAIPKAGPTPVLSLRDMIATFVRAGDVVALEGFTHLIPFAAGHEVIRQGIGELTLIRMTPDLLYDQMIGAGLVTRLVFSWGGNPGVGSLHRLRDAVRTGHPRALELEEHSHAAMAAAWDAGAANLPFAVLRGYRGTDLARHNPNVRSVACPFTGEALAAVPALRPDVGVIHAQRADRAGNVLLEGIVGVQKQVVLASTHALVTVEEVVDDLGELHPNACVIPSFVVSAIAEVPGGSRPSYAYGYYDRDNAAYLAWDPISRDREAFAAWLDALRAGVQTGGQA